VRLQRRFDHLEECPVIVNHDHDGPLVGGGVRRLGRSAERLEERYDIARGGLK
jgi:hypothetical protein